MSRQLEEKLEEALNELARLLKEDDNPCERHEAHSIAPRSGGSKGFVPHQAEWNQATE